MTCRPEVINGKRVGTLFFVIIKVLVFFIFPKNVCARVYTFAWVPPPVSNPVYYLGRDAALAKAQEIKERNGDEIKVLYVGSETMEPAQQEQIIRELIAKKVNGIAVASGERNSLTGVIDQAVQAGIPVLCWDIDCPASQRFLGPSGRIAVLTGDPKNEVTTERMRGFTDVLQDYPDLRVITSVNGQIDAISSAQAVEDALRKHPDLNGWYFTDAWPFSRVDAMPTWKKLTEAGTLMNIASGRLPADLDFLNRGFIKNYAPIRFWYWGYYAIEALYQSVAEKKSFNRYFDPIADQPSSETCQCENRRVMFW
ncbi:MAG: substrate-binding domain-containing protein [Candidatus Atribacteria bacterium]|nr:substrate-binding domain-containing protein [Candidatus Atribacteria bacterium]